MSKIGRLLPLSAHDGATNMAIDEAIVAAVAEGTVPATLRFYAWSRPTLSLGYFQTVAGAGEWSGKPIDLVRRSTGGGAIMHHHELTYSLALPVTDMGPGARGCVYRTVHECVIATLKQMGVAAATYRDTVGVSSGCTPAERSAAPTVAPEGLRPAAKNSDESFLCFQRRTSEDLICGGYKILGSAQRRVRGGVLQHGSLLLRVSPHADVLPGANDLSAVDMNATAIAPTIASRIGDAMSISWQCGELHDAELDASRTICTDRYAAAQWTRRR